MGARIVFLPFVHPSRWAEAAARHQRDARAEFVEHGPTPLFHALRTQARNAETWARDIEHLRRVVAEVNAELEVAR